VKIGGTATATTTGNGPDATTTMTETTPTASAAHVHGRPDPGRFCAGTLRGRKSTVRTPYGAGSGGDARAGMQPVKADNVIITGGVDPNLPVRAVPTADPQRLNPTELPDLNGWRSAARRLEQGSVVTRRTATMVETDVASGIGGAVGLTAA
jgi:hypothetical protein